MEILVFIVSYISIMYLVSKAIVIFVPGTDEAVIPSNICIGIHKEKTHYELNLLPFYTILIVD